MSRKADLSVNTIIIIALGLMILVIMTVVISGRVKMFTKSADSCADKGGVCEANFATCADKGGATVTVKECQDKGQVCCVIFKESTQEAGK